MDTLRTYHLEEFNNSGSQLKDGQADIIGWDVTDTQGQPLGTIADLLFDAAYQKVRYLIIDLADRSKKILIPIGVAGLSADNKVVIPVLSDDQLAALPAYEQGNVTPEAELTVQQAFNGVAAAATAFDRNSFYAHDHFDVDRFYDRGATMRSILPVTEEDSLDDIIVDDAIELPAENPFDAAIEKEEPGLGKIGY